MSDQTIYTDIATEDTVVREWTDCQFEEGWCTTHNVAASIRKTRSRVMDRVVVGGDTLGTERLVYKLVETLTCTAVTARALNLGRLTERGRVNRGVTHSYLYLGLTFGEVGRDEQYSQPSISRKPSGQSD